MLPGYPAGVAATSPPYPTPGWATPVYPAQSVSKASPKRLDPKASRPTPKRLDPKASPCRSGVMVRIPVEIEEDRVVGLPRQS